MPESSLLIWHVPQWFLFQSPSISVICLLACQLVSLMLTAPSLNWSRPWSWHQHVPVKPPFIHFLLFLSKTAHPPPPACSHLRLLFSSKHIIRLCFLDLSVCFPRSSLPGLYDSGLTLQGTCPFLFQLGLQPRAKLGCWSGGPSGTLCISWESWPLAHSAAQCSSLWNNSGTVRFSVYLKSTAV